MVYYYGLLEKFSKPELGIKLVKNLIKEENQTPQLLNKVLILKAHHSLEISANLTNTK